MPRHSPISWRQGWGRNMELETSTGFLVGGFGQRDLDKCLFINRPAYCSGWAGGRSIAYPAGMCPADATTLNQGRGMLSRSARAEKRVDARSEPGGDEERAGASSRGRGETDRATGLEPASDDVRTENWRKRRGAQCRRRCTRTRTWGCSLVIQAKSRRRFCYACVSLWFA